MSDPQDDHTGTVVQFDAPHWAPLLKVVDESDVADFMWMHEVHLSSGHTVHAYKHADTRRYLHLAVDGAVFLYTDSGQYRPVPLSDVLAEVFQR